jgi:hypothetical protein
VKGARRRAGALGGVEGDGGRGRGRGVHGGNGTCRNGYGSGREHSFYFQEGKGTGKSFAIFKVRALRRSEGR